MRLLLEIIMASPLLGTVTGMWFAWKRHHSGAAVFFGGMLGLVLPLMMIGGLGLVAGLAVGASVTPHSRTALIGSKAG